MLGPDGVLHLSISMSLLEDFFIVSSFGIIGVSSRSRARVSFVSESKCERWQ